jgi:hypothetical protein
MTPPCHLATRPVARRATREKDGPGGTAADAA